MAKKIETTKERKPNYNLYNLNILRMVPLKNKEEDVDKTIFLFYAGLNQIFIGFVYPDNKMEIEKTFERLKKMIPPTWSNVGDYNIKYNGVVNYWAAPSDKGRNYRIEDVLK